MNKYKPTLLNFATYMRYHTDCFNEFVEHRDYEKLDEFVMLCEFIEYFRENLTSPKATIIIEEYVIEIKNFAYTFNDYCEQYGYDSTDYHLIVDYTDTVLAL